MELNSPEYYRRRERQERQLAEQAQMQRIKSIHLDMARRYADLVDIALSAEAPRPRLSICS